MSAIDPIEFKRMLLLGAQVSKKIPEFARLASLGYKTAATYSFFMWLEWLDKKPDATFEQAIMKLIELQGMAEFLVHSKELTRLSMIIGDQRKSFVDE